MTQLGINLAVVYKNKDIQIYTRGGHRFFGDVIKVEIVDNKEWLILKSLDHKVRVLVSEIIAWSEFVGGAWEGRF